MRRFSSSSRSLVRAISTPPLIVARPSSSYCRALSFVSVVISFEWSTGKMKFDAWPVEPPGFGSAPCSISTRSVQPSRDRWYAMLLPTMPAPITTACADEGGAVVFTRRSGRVAWPLRSPAHAGASFPRHDRRHRRGLPRGARGGRAPPAPALAPGRVRGTRCGAPARSTPPGSPRGTGCGQSGRPGGGSARPGPSARARRGRLESRARRGASPSRCGPRRSRAPRQGARRGSPEPSAPRRGWPDRGSPRSTRTCRGGDRPPPVAPARGDGAPRASACARCRAVPSDRARRSPLRGATRARRSSPGSRGMPGRPARPPRSPRAGGHRPAPSPLPRRYITHISARSHRHQSRLGLLPEEVDLYGRFKAKLDLSVLDRLAANPDAKLIDVTAITPTKAGEGKTTTSVSLTQGLGHIGREPVLCLREASLGPVFGIKGGAAGGGYAQVVPMEDMNLHFTGDIHAIGVANNLLSAMLEAHILHGNVLGIDPLTVSWRRCVDMNDRALRGVVIGLGGRANGYVRETGFDITAASEVMAIAAVSRDLFDLRKRLGAITVAYTWEGEIGRASCRKECRSRWSP